MWILGLKGLREHCTEALYYFQSQIALKEHCKIVVWCRLRTFLRNKGFCMDYETVMCLKTKGAKGHHNITLEAMP